jgi:exopolysaccharide biosynthesis polyprenyl glycosylphosphotransferase
MKQAKSGPPRPHWGAIRPASDAVLFLAAFMLAYLVRYELQWWREVEPAFQVPLRVYVPSGVVLAAILLLVYWLDGAYHPPRGRGLFDELTIVLRGTITGIATMIFGVFLVTPSYYSRLIFGYTGIIILVLVGLSRAIEHAIITRRRRRGHGVRGVLVVGAGEVGRAIMRTVVARPDLGYKIIGFVDDDPHKAQTDIGRYPALGTTDRLPELLHGQGIEEVIITLPWLSYRNILTIMGQCERFNVPARIVPDLLQMGWSKVKVDDLGGIPLLGVQEPTLRDWQIVVRRGMNVLVAALALLIASPLIALIALAIKLNSPGPVIFKQIRVGRGGREFTVWKFRSMYMDAEARVHELRAHNEASGPLFKMRNDPRRTAVGRLLRHTSLDEIPQFWNVLRGDMSVVGPRPGLPSEVAEYQSWHRRRLEVSPGITGLWQVSGRSDLTFDEMVLLDIYYIENWSPFLDLRIMFMTIPSILFGSGAY